MRGVAAMFGGYHAFHRSILADRGIGARCRYLRVYGFDPAVCG